MARNEEKQLARLNRLLLKQQKDEEIKKRPPRPRLETLSTADEVKKWMPSILHDIDFYVKQMEVPCYPEHTIAEFTNRIDGLRGEYKAFVRKIRQLEPDLQVTPWTDRPYTSTKRKRPEVEHDGLEEDIQEENKELSDDSIMIKTPILQLDSHYKRCYGYNTDITKPVKDNLSTTEQDEPLQLNFSNKDLVKSQQQQQLQVCASTSSYNSSIPQRTKPLPKWLRTKTKSNSCINSLKDSSQDETSNSVPQRHTYIQTNLAPWKAIENHHRIQGSAGDAYHTTDHTSDKNSSSSVTSSSVPSSSVPSSCGPSSAAPGSSVTGRLSLPYTDSSSDEET